MENYKKISNSAKVRFVILLFVACLLPSLSFSASIYYETEEQVINLNQDFLVNVYLDAQGESVNAIDGNIVFPKDILSVKEIRDGNSAVHFWLERPVVKTASSAGEVGSSEVNEGRLSKQGLREIVFSGISTAGISGTREPLFSVVFQGTNVGDGYLKAGAMKILKNDGKGTEAQVTDSPITLKIVDEPNLFTPPVPTISDANPPEAFLPTINQDPDVFGGKYFVVFATQDKESGIDHYEVQEGQWGKSIKATSPHMLQYQSLDRKIYIKAVDKNGNERLATLEAQKKMPWYQQFAIISVLLAVIIVALLLRNLWLKFIR